jgi:galactokinase
VSIPSVSLAISGTLPRGAGLSSSAALEVSLCLALLAHAGVPALDRVDLARLCSRIENIWVGARSGLLDQLASLCCVPGHALLIDFSDLSLAPVPLKLGAFQLVIVDSGEQHRLGESGYNERRCECEEASEQLGVDTLSQARSEDLDGLPPALARRARHVLSENARVRACVSALEADELARVGSLLNASHASLRDLYEVSTPAVEATVTRLLDQGALGARLVGGGFGGSVLALLGPNVVPPVGAMVIEAGPPARLFPG